jgi:hypothetical protein
MDASPPHELFPVDDALRFRPADDQLHPWTAHPDWAETVWFSFNVPERNLAGWLYTQVRPVLGTAAGGAFVYDPSAHVSWELPYFSYTHHQTLPVPAEELDLAHVAFKNGCSLDVVEPGMVYELGYRFRDLGEFDARLRFEGLTPPVPHLQGAPPFTGSSHYDQHGRVTGELMLHGESISVDCFAVRDRSWGRRPEHVGLGVPRLSYAFGTFSPDDAFLAFCLPEGGDQESFDESLSSGYLLRDGRLRRLARARRRTLRDRATGGVARMELSLEDVDGRRLEVSGEAGSRMFLATGGLCINTFLRFEADRLGTGWGEDQDVFSSARFAQLRRAGIA